MAHIFHLPKNYSFDKIGHKGKIFPTELLSGNAQFVFLEVEDGIDIALRQRECDYFYYVLEGSGSFEVDGGKEECAKGDLAVVPAGSKFIYKGKMKLLLVSIPSWYPEQEEAA